MDCPFDCNCQKAMAEIERLQVKTKADAEAWHEQEEKIERLRAALEKIADPSISWGHMKKIARDAVGPTRSD